MSEEEFGSVGLCVVVRTFVQDAFQVGHLLDVGPG